ncbi:MAG: 4'-phosphopantetheinyl transferase superfamily protein [Capsulimonadales bacterium]|nr:4'-phosphopantetheinyl transferase superfamily protein [Capsulimonadales bacterium]
MRIRHLSDDAPIPEVSAFCAHLYTARLDMPEERRASLRACLSAGEAARAARFHFERDRNRYVVGRGLLREILSRYTGIAPNALRLETTAEGKPYLADRSGPASLHFNVSHSEDRAVYAVLRDHAVGVDIERIRTDFEVTELAGSYFSVPEIRELASLPTADRHAAFFGFWARKEAYLKALGTGLLCPLREFAVSLTSPEVRRLTPSGEPIDVSEWWVHPLALADGFASAIALPVTVRQTIVLPERT